MSSTYKLPISGFSVSDYSSQYNTTYAATTAIDGSTSTYWMCNPPTGAYITLQLGTAAIATKFRIYVGSSSYYSTSWTLFGSNDGTTFTEIASGACTSVTGWQEFNFENETAYTFYKWVCNTGNSSYLYTYEIELWKTVSYVKADGKYIGITFDETLVGDPTGENPSPIGGWAASETEASIASVSTSGNYSSSYPAAKLIDGSTSTYWRCPSGGTIGSYFILGFSESVALGGFSFYQSISYYPRAFTIYGSQDESVWSVIASVTNSETTEGWKKMSFSNGTGYLYYKFEITSGSNPSTLYIYEVKAWLAKKVGNEQAFTVTGKVYNWVPNGSLVDETFTVADVLLHPSISNSILLEIVDNDRFESVIGELTVSYDKSLGNLAGYGGPSDSFYISFSPEDLVWKGDQNDQEHLEATFEATGVLIRVYRTDSSTGVEHINFTNIVASGVLTNVSDI